MTSRPSTAAPILAVLAIVLVTLGLYGAAYLWLGTRGVIAPAYNRPPTAYVRGYPKRWQRVVFLPAASVESLWLGVPVELIDLPQSGS